MTIDYYFPMEVSLTHDEQISDLTEEMGMEGLGIFTKLLLELRQMKDYRCSQNTIRQIARQANIEIEKIEQVIYKYSLFQITEEEGKTWYSSFYLNRVMEKYDKKKQVFSEAGKRGAKARMEKNSNSDLSHPSTTELSHPSAIDKNKIKKRKEKEVVVIINNDQEEIADEAINDKTTTTTTEAPLWEKCIDQVTSEKSWMELQAKNSGLYSEFQRYPQEVIEIFKVHIKTQGTEDSIKTLRDAKNYFANFIRKNSKTYQWVKEQLRRVSENDPYRFESVDPVTGKRTCFGHEIPDYAPPRPSSHVCWDDICKTWC